MHGGVKRFVNYSVDSLGVEVKGRTDIEYKDQDMLRESTTPGSSIGMQQTYGVPIPTSYWPRI